MKIKTLLLALLAAALNSAAQTNTNNITKPVTRGNLTSTNNVTVTNQARTGIPMPAWYPQLYQITNRTAQVTAQRDAHSKSKRAQAEQIEMKYQAGQITVQQMDKARTESNRTYDAKIEQFNKQIAELELQEQKVRTMFNLPTVARRRNR